MSFRIARYILACAVMLAPTAAIAQTASAQVTTPDQERHAAVVFTSATRLPGITLEPGTYVFRLGTPAMKQNVVEVYSTDGTKKIATFLTVDYPEPMTGTTTTVLYPNTNTVRAWYFPGDPVGRAFVYSEDEARTLYTTSTTPVLWATWNPDDDMPIGTVRVETWDDNVGDQVADAAKAVGNAAVDVAKAVGDRVEDVWDDVTDNARLENPTESRKLAERQLDAAEKTFDGIEERVGDAQEAHLAPFRGHFEALEDTFERNDASWMTHYTAAMAELDRLAPERPRPVGTAGGTVMLDVTTQASLGTIRAQLRAFHDHAMK